MSLFGHPILLIFLLCALSAFLVSLFWKKVSLILDGIGIVLLGLYTVNALFLGFHPIEMIATLLTMFLLFLIILLIKRKKT